MVPAIQEFTSYRIYLRAVYGDAKDKNPSLTQARFGVKMGVGGSTFKMILAGKRRLSPSHVTRIAHALKFSEADLEYLVTLRELEHARSRREHRYWLSRLRAKKDENQVRSVRLADREFIADPYFPALWILLAEILRTTPEKADEGHLSRLTGLAASRVRSMLRGLLVMGLPPRSDSLHIVFDKLSNPIQQKLYLQEWLKEAAKRIDEDYFKVNTFFGSTTLALTDDEFMELKAEIKGVIAKYLGRSAASANQRKVFQVSHQAFPLFEGGTRASGKA